MDSNPSTPSTSRPVSRAQSDVSFATATEHTPGSPQQPRTLGQEIDHVKNLISRSQVAPRQSEGTITAQIFRRRSNSTEPVPHTRILHELDNLKRRIRQQETLVRRPSQMDPETEDEDDTIDEREEELDDIRRELANERTQREEWLASAEHRVDILTSEKDGLMQQLDQTKGQLAELRDDKEDLEHRAMDAETKAQGLQEQLEHTRNTSDAARRDYADLQASYDDAQETGRSTRLENENLSKKLDALQQSLRDAESSVKDLRSEKETSNSAAEALKQDLAKLQQSNTELEKTLAERNEKISGFEDNSEIAGQHLQRIVAEHKSKKEESLRRINELEDSHAKAQTSLEESQSKIEGLEKNASDHDVRRRELVQQADEQRKLLDNAKKDIDLHSKELKQLLKEHEAATSQAKTLTGQKNELQIKYDSLLKEKDSSVQDLEAGHREVMDGVTGRHEAELKKLRDELDDAKNAHSSELENTQSAHRKELDDLRATAGKERETASSESAQLNSTVSELSDKIAKAEKQNEELLRTKEASHQSHIKKAEESMTEMEQRLLSAEKRAEDAESSLKAKELDLSNQLSAKNNELSGIHGQLSELQRKFYDQSAELDRKVTELSAAAEEQKKLEEDGKGNESALNGLQQRHASEMDELKSSHKSTISKHESKHQEVERELADLKVQHAAEIAALKSSYEESAGQTTSEHQTALAVLKQDLAKVQAVMEAASKTSEEQVSRLKTEHEQHIRELESGWSSKADEGTRTHQADMQSAANEASAQLTRAREESQKHLDERNADADARLAGVREEHAAELAKTQKEHQYQLDEATAALDQAKREVESRTADRNKTASDLGSRDAEIERLRADHQRELQDTQSKLETTKQDLAHKHDEDLREALSNANREHEVRMQARMQVNYGKAYEENKRMFEVRAADAEKASHEKMATREGQHRKELQDLASKHQGELGQQLQDHEQTSKASIERELEAVRATHQAELDQVRREHDESSKAMLDQELSSAKDKHAAELEELAREHEESLKTRISRELEAARSSHQAEIDALRRTHDDSSRTVLDSELESIRKSHQAELAAVHRGSEEAMNHIREDADREWRRRLARLEEEHESTLAAALTNADEELDERLRAQSKAHSKQFDRLQESLHGELESLQMQLEEATVLRLAQTRQADADSQKTLEELGEKLRAAEQTSTQLQARLDVELTGRADSERSLADLRKQRFEEEKNTTASTESLQKQIASLTAEKTALSKRNSAIFIPRDSTRTVAESSTTRDTAEEMSMLKLKLMIAEQEREQAQIAGQQEADEKSELARQNDFLVKELETLMATRNAEAASVPVKQDASAQTESDIGMSDGEDTRMVREQKSDASLSAATKRLQQSPRPVTPSTPKNQSNGTSDSTWKNGSFEQYLQQAQAELSELGSVISANEALFAQKIQEHFGDLQRAKNLITTEYEEKFKALLAQRDKTEKDFSARNAAEFAQERRRLVASYGADHDEPEQQVAAVTNLSSPERQALKSAEERLVSEYNRRIVKRKSQIAIKHAEDYQNLTQDFDRRLAELLGNRQRLESDLSVEPSKFEQDLGQYEAMSAQLETEKATSTPNSPQAKRFSRDGLADAQSKKTFPGASAAIDHAAKSQLPKRTVSVTPRTSTGIPRAVPFPGNRESLDGANPPHRPRRSVDALRTVSERHPPAKQHASTTKSPPTPIAPKHIASNPRSSGSPLQPVKSKFSAEPSETEQKPAAPEIVKPTPHAFRSIRNKGRSLRHSSRVIVGDWQATNDI